jgi:mono/diheme cytochrome c family protein
MHRITYAVATAWLFGILLCVTSMQHSGANDEVPGSGFHPSRYHADLSPEAEETVARELKGIFGTAARPHFAGVAACPDWDEDSKSYVRKLADGRALFARHCARCHGDSGEGSGQDSPGLNPAPRDFRDGMFKWTSTTGPGGSRPTLHDLMETVRVGVPDTAMPAFEEILKPEQRRAVALWVRWLSIRGVTEERFRFLIKSFPQNPGYRALLVGHKTDEWDRREWIEFSTVPRTEPPDFDDSVIEAGRKLFQQQHGCADCHGESGRGGGMRTTRPALLRLAGKWASKPGLVDYWDNPVTPRDLTQDVLRSGTSPQNLYTRIAAGIKAVNGCGAGMRRPHELWSLVAFVISLREGEPGKGVTRRDPDPLAGRAVGSGHITGHVRFSDPKTASPDPASRGDVGIGVARNSLIADPETGGLANCIVHLQRCPAGFLPVIKPEQETVTIRFRDGRTEPRVRLVLAGQTIVYQNDGPGKIQLKASGIRAGLQPGMSVERNWGRAWASLNRIQCDGYDRAHTLVLAHRFAAVTDANGDFTIRDVPAGSHRLHIWHERVSGLLFRDFVDVPANGKVRVPLEVTIDQFFGDVLEKQ